MKTHGRPRRTNAVDSHRRPVVQENTMAKANRKSTEETAAAAKGGKAKKTAAQREAEASETNAQRITPLKKVTDIHSHEGTFCYAEILAALTSKTVGEAKEKLAVDKHNPTPERGLELAWIQKRGYIKVVEA
jgi:hypothetical protein